MESWTSRDVPPIEAIVLEGLVFPGMETTTANLHERVADVDERLKAALDHRLQLGQAPILAHDVICHEDAPSPDQRGG
jgi:hypothetical protein